MSKFTNIVVVRPRGQGPYDIDPRFGQVYKTVPSTSYDYVIVAGDLFWLDDEDLVKPDITRFSVVSGWHNVW
jgi:hypothetical protein